MEPIPITNVIPLNINYSYIFYSFVELFLFAARFLPQVNFSVSIMFLFQIIFFSVCSFYLIMIYLHDVQIQSVISTEELVLTTHTLLLTGEIVKFVL